MKNANTKLPGQRRNHCFYVGLTKEEYDFVTLVARSTVSHPVDWIRNTILKDRSPKFKIHPWQADVYRELQLIRLSLQQLPERIPPAQIEKLEGLYLKIIQTMTDDSEAG